MGGMQLGQYLFISEIFNSICSQFDTEEDYGRSPLAALARTCRSFHKTALDHLWSDINDIAPLVKCMPSDLWKEARDEFEEEPEEFSRPLLDSDWTRFREHSRRVRSITVVEHPQCSPDVYRLLGEATDQPLLPNVRKVVWSPPNFFAYLPHLQYVMGPKVIDLTLPIDFKYIRFNRDEWFDAIRNLSSTYPLLEHVDLRLAYSPNLVLEEQLVSSIICGWTQLRTLEVNSLSPATLAHIASLPYLQRLSFADVDTDTPLEEFPPTHTRPSFPALQSLKVIARGLSFCRSMIETLRSSPLQQVHIEVYGHQLTSAWRHFFVAVQNNCNMFTLTSIKFREYYHPLVKECRVEYTATIDTIQPLLSFPNLVSIHLPFSQIIIANSAAPGMAMAWPRVKHLSLLPAYPVRQSRPCLTLQGLAAFAEHCQELEYLNLTLGALSIPSTSSKHTDRGRGKKTLVLMLDFAGSPIESSQEVAAFLSKNHFRIQSVRYETDISDGVASGWWEVAFLLERHYSGNLV